MTISTEAKSGKPQLSICWGEPYVDGDGKRSAWVRSTGLGEAYLSKLDAIELDRDLRRSLLSELFLGNMGSVAARSMAEHFLRSACNWGLALFAAEVPGMRQADPEAFGQLMQASTLLQVTRYKLPKVQVTKVTRAHAGVDGGGARRRVDV